MRKYLLALGFLTVATPAFAQFPPPGIYHCVNGMNMDMGTLSLLAAGDYSFESEALPAGSGQIASSGNSVNVVSGPLAEISLTGSFRTSDDGVTVFDFTGEHGAMRCGPAN